MEATDVRGVLLEAKQRLLKEGWIQTHYHLPGQGYCLYGAIAATPKLRGLRDDVCRRLFPGDDSEQDCHSRMTCWNDVSNRTVDDVIDLIDLTLLSLAQEGGVNGRDQAGSTQNERALVV